MKRSERLERQSQQEDNDLKSYGLLCKALREKRSERFVEDYLPIIRSRYNVELRPSNSYSITTQDHGIIDYFPKANKLLLRKKNKWIKPGLKWILNNLIE